MKKETLTKRIAELRQPAEARRIVERLRRGGKPTEDESEPLLDDLMRAGKKRDLAQEAGDRVSDSSAGATVQIVKTFAAGALKWAAGVRRKNTKAADAKHDKPGGSRDKRKKIIDAWQSGKYTSKDTCAEQEAAAIGMSFSVARKALRNVSKKPT